MDPDCIFCKILAGELPAVRVYEDEHSVAFMDINPWTRGHAVVIPREHTRNLYEIGDEDLRDYFRDVSDHAVRANEIVEGHRDLLNGILEANLAQVSVRQNDDMRKITAWAAIAAIPTVIGAIYGMNFKNMPELRWDFGYPLAVGVMLAICVALYSYFKRVGWL